MRHRGEKYWSWADPAVHCRTHDETLIDGITIDVQIRLSAKRDIQMFIGVYALDGMPLKEETYYSRPNESMTTSLAWGVERARRLAMDAGARS